MGFVRILSAQSLPHLDPDTSVVAADDARAWLDAQQLLRDANAEAQAIVDSAKVALDAERQRGYNEGLEQARFEQTERMIETATRTVDLFASIEQKMVALVMDAVRRILADYDEHERVIAVVRSSLAVLRNQRQLTLRLAPEHVEHVKARAASLLEEFPGVGILDIAPDPRLKGDAAILESEIGVVEASIASQLKAIEQGFAKMLGSRI